MKLPHPTAGQPYCDISVLEAGFVNVPLKWVVDITQDDERTTLPVLAFLLRHSKSQKKLLFDLGIRRDWENLPPAFIKKIKAIGFGVEVPQYVVAALAKGGTRPEDIDFVCISHLHFDHVGYTKPFTNVTYLAGEGCRPLVEDGYPANPESFFTSDLLPASRTHFLSAAEWPPLGPFEHALDFYGDGSLYIVDAGPGHLPRHVNLLIRTSSDGGWVYLAGDSAHDRRLLTGEANIAKTDMFGCAHHDAALQAKHIAKIRALMDAEPRVQVILSHDLPWYEVDRNGDALWPGKLWSLSLGEDGTS